MSRKQPGPRPRVLSPADPAVRVPTYQEIAAIHEPWDPDTEDPWSYEERMMAKVMAALSDGSIFRDPAPQP